VASALDILGHAVITILYLAANPIDSERLRSDRELREIQDIMRDGKGSDRFRLVSVFAARVQDIAAAVKSNNPQIVHFAGHAYQGGLIIEDERGRSALLPAERIASLFGSAVDGISCVILNASHTAETARVISRYVDYVVAMNEIISDEGAIAFSTGFYQALAAGRPIPDAFEYAVVYLKIRVQEYSKEQEPILFTKRT
jgi:hypothetical protein